MSDGWPGAAVAAVFVIILLVDNLRTFRLRDVLTLSGTVAVLVVLGICGLAAGDVKVLAGGLAGAVGMFAVGFAVELTSPSTLGFGTVKASLLVGAAAGGLGWVPWLSALVGLALSLVVLGLATLRTTSRRPPTGPALAVALIVASGAAL